MAIRRIAIADDFVEALGPTLAGAEYVSIEIERESFVRVTARFALDSDTGDKIACVVKRYILVEPDSKDSSNAG